MHVSVFIIYTQENLTKQTTELDYANYFAQIVQLVLYSVWPFFVMGLLLHQQDKLENFDFKRKFSTMYDGLNIKMKWAIIY